MLGRAATMMSWSGWKPLVKSSRSWKPGRDAGDRVLLLGPLGDQVHRLLEDVLDLVGLALDLVLGDREDLLLGRLEELLGGEEVRVAVADDVGRALDELAADRLLADDLGVILGVGGVRDAVGDLQEHLVAADLLVLIAAGQLVGERHRVDGLAQVVKVADGPVDRSGARRGRSLDAEELGDVVQDLVVQQDARPGRDRSASRFWGGRWSLSEPPAITEDNALPVPPFLPFPELPPDSDDMRAKSPLLVLRHSKPGIHRDGHASLSRLPSRKLVLFHLNRAAKEGNW